MFAPPRAHLSLRLLAILFCVSLALPPVSGHALVSISPSLIPAGTATTVTLTPSTGELAADEGLVFVYNTSSIRVLDTACRVGVVPDNPQTCTISLDTNAIPNSRGWVGSADHLLSDLSTLNVGDNPFSLGGVSFTVGQADTTIHNRLVGITPAVLFRGMTNHATLTLADLSSTGASVTISLATGSDMSGGFYSRIGTCDTRSCYLNLIVPATAPLGTAYIANTGTTVTDVLEVMIAEGPPDVITSMTPTLVYMDDPNPVFTFTGSMYTTTATAYSDTLSGTLTTTYVDSSTIRVTIPTATLTPGVHRLGLEDFPYGVYGSDNAHTFTVLYRSATDTAISIDVIHPQTLVAGTCTPVVLTTNTPFSGWPTSPTVAFEYRTQDGSENISDPITADVHLTESMFFTDVTYGTVIQTSLCLPSNAYPSENNRIAPGGLVNSQPTAWMYPSGTTYTINATTGDPRITTISPTSIALASNATTITVQFADSDAASREWWVHLASNETWYRVGTDTGTVTDIDSGTVQLTIPADFFTSTDALLVELYDNVSNAYSDRYISITGQAQSALRALTLTGVSAVILDTPRTDFTTYSTPVPVTLTASLQADAGTGDIDALAASSSAFTIAAANSGTTTVAVTSSSDTAASGTTHLPAGTHTITFAGVTNSGTTLTQSTTLRITETTVELNATPLVQLGEAVGLTVGWPTTTETSDRQIDCGTSTTQVLTDDSGQCLYTTPGTYTVQGRFSDALGTNAIRTAIRTVTVPALAPAGAALRATSIATATPTHDTTAAVVKATSGLPTVYPVPVELRLTLDPSTEVGIADPLDVSQSRVRIKTVATTDDLTTPITSGDVNLRLEAASSTEFTASTTLTNFTPSPTSTDASAWQQRIVLDGVTSTGLPVAAELLLEGARGDGSQIGWTWKRIDPIYPYAPSAYRYVISNLQSAVSNEPITHTWTGSDDTAAVLEGNGSFTATFTTPGAKTVQMAITSPLSGDRTWVDPNPPTVPEIPAGNPIAFYITVPTKNRPPATYRFQPNYPTLEAGEKLSGDPTWAMNGEVKFAGQIFYYTFTTAGTHEVVIAQATTLRTLYGKTSVTVNENHAPTGTLSCASSYIDKTSSTWKWVLYCKTVNAKDPDGRLTAITWSLPSRGVSSSGSTYYKYSLTTPQSVTVRAVLTDDSGATTTLEQLVDLTTLK